MQIITGSTINYESGEFYALDKVGLDFWCLLQDEKSIGDIVSTLISTYRISEDQLWKDLEELVATMVEKRMITLFNPSLVVSTSKNQVHNSIRQAERCFDKKSN